MSGYGLFRPTFASGEVIQCSSFRIFDGDFNGALRCGKQLSRTLPLHSCGKNPIPNFSLSRNGETRNDYFS